jgi:hypothetical protein
VAGSRLWLPDISLKQPFRYIFDMVRRAARPSTDGHVLQLGTPPAMVRRRALVVIAILATISCLLTVGTVALIRFGGSAHRGLAWAIFVGALLPIVMPLLCMERQQGELIARHGPEHSLLTTATLTGLRTADLSKLRSVRLLLMPARFTGGVVMLVIRDNRGVRIGLTRGESVAAVHQALRSLYPPPTARPKVTRSAERFFSERSSSLAELLVPFALGILWYAVVSGLCLAIALG